MRDVRMSTRRTSLWADLAGARAPSAGLGRPSARLAGSRYPSWISLPWWTPSQMVQPLVTRSPYVHLTAQTWSLVACQKDQISMSIQGSLAARRLTLRIPTLVGSVVSVCLTSSPLLRSAAHRCSSNSSIHSRQSLLRQGGSKILQLLKDQLKWRRRSSRWLICSRSPQMSSYSNSKSFTTTATAIRTWLQIRIQQARKLSRTTLRLSRIYKYVRLIINPTTNSRTLTILKCYVTSMDLRLSHSPLLINMATTLSRTQQWWILRVAEFRQLCLAWGVVKLTLEALIEMMGSTPTVLHQKLTVT